MHVSWLAYGQAWRLVVGLTLSTRALNVFWALIYSIRIQDVLFFGSEDFVLGRGT